MERPLDVSSETEKIDTITCSFWLTLNEAPGDVLETYFVYSVNQKHMSNYHQLKTDTRSLKKGGTPTLQFVKSLSIEQNFSTKRAKIVKITACFPVGRELKVIISKFRGEPFLWNRI